MKSVFGRKKQNMVVYYQQAVPYTDRVKHKETVYLSCIHPFHGQNSYFNLQGEIAEVDSDWKTNNPSVLHHHIGRKMATMPKLISIVYDAYRQKAGSHGRLPEHIDAIKSVMGNGFYAATKTLWIPDKGAKVFPDDGTIHLPDHLRHRTGNISSATLESLLKILEQHPNSVVDVPFGFEEGGMFPVDLELNTYLRALAGRDGAGKLHEIAGIHLGGIYPQLIAYRGVEQPKITVSRLRSSRFMGLDWGLIIDCVGDGRYNKGYAFEVLR